MKTNIDQPIKDRVAIRIAKKIARNMLRQKRSWTVEEVQVFHWVAVQQSEKVTGKKMLTSVYYEIEGQLIFDLCWGK